MPDSQLPRGDLLAMRIGDKVFSTKGGPAVLDEVHYWLGSPLTRLAIVVYDRDGQQLAAWKSSIAQTVGSASDQNNDLPLAVTTQPNLTVDFNPAEPNDVRLLTNCTLSRLLERVQRVGDQKRHSQRCLPLSGHPRRLRSPCTGGEPVRALPTSRWRCAPWP